MTELPFHPARAHLSAAGPEPSGRRQRLASSIGRAAEIPHMHPSKLLRAVLTWGALGLGTARAQPLPGVPPQLSITATSTLVSQYLYRGQRLGGASLQPALDAVYGPGNVGLWLNLPLRDRVPNVSDPEVDLYGSYQFHVSPVLSLVPGFTWYGYPQAPTAEGYYRSAFEPNVALNLTVAGVKLSPKVHYDVQRQGPTYEFTALYALPLKNLGTELDFIGTAGSFLHREAVNQAQPPVKAWGDYWLLGVSAPFQFSAASRFLVGWAYTEGRNAYGKQGGFPKVPHRLAAGRGVVTLSYAHRF
jgi:hypothetical protein